MDSTKKLICPSNILVQFQVESCKWTRNFIVDISKSRRFNLLVSFIFYLLLISCSVGHQGKFGHEFMEFEFQSNGKLRYANNSNYKNDVMIRKEGKGLYIFSISR